MEKEEFEMMESILKQVERLYQFCLLLEKRIKLTEKYLLET